MLLFDAHLDLAMNALEWNRDLTRPVAEIRAREQGMSDKPDRGRGTVSLPEMRRGGIGLCVATMIARFVKRANPLSGWNSPEQAWAQTQGQLAWYRAMEQAGELVQIVDAAGLKRRAGTRRVRRERIRGLGGRGAVVGGVLDAWMLVPGWVRGQTTPQSAGLKLERLIDHMDHICQLAGNARHIGIGSDLDGAYGREQ